MTSNQRREGIVALLARSAQPVSATALAKELGVTRQVIVGDIALLRASGTDILAVPKGYILVRKEKAPGIERIIACSHSPEQTGREIYTIVDNGGTLVDVTVEHPLYGQLTAQLNIASRYDTDEFLRLVAENRAALLSKLTDGVHLHTIRCRDEEAYRRIVEALEREGLLLDRG